MKDTLIEVYFTYENKQSLNAVFNFKKETAKDVVFKGQFKESIARVKPFPEFQIFTD